MRHRISWDARVKDPEIAHLTLRHIKVPAAVELIEQGPGIVHTPAPFGCEFEPFLSIDAARAALAMGWEPHCATPFDITADPTLSETTTMFDAAEAPAAPVSPLAANLPGEFVVITTVHRGVFFGEVAAITPDLTGVTLLGAQMAVYWDTTMRGVFGLASAGPGDQCRIGPPVKRLVLHDVTAIAYCENADVVKAWKSAPWRD